jgi:phosphoglycolate phosphatase
MQPFPGMRELLVSLSGTSTLAIATGKSRRGLDRALKVTGLAPHFRASRCADETQPKPHPAMLHELMAELGASPAEMLMVGDTSHDLRMAAAAGVDAVAVSYGAHAREGLLACGPRGCAASVEELRSWLRQNG